jgi:uncharacterized protein YceH (UPF0502 family)
MGDRTGDLSTRVEAVERKVDGLAASMDVRFDQVNAALVEQRAYTEFAYDRLDEKLNALDARMESRFGRLEGNMEARFAQVDAHVARLDRKLDQLLDRRQPE